VSRVLTEIQILQRVDHPFVATLHCVLQTPSHLHLIMEACGGGDLYSLIDAQPNKRLREQAVKFYAAEVLLALQYLHLMGFVYR
jgi:phototropin